jgi:hypothetical protein
MKMDKLRALYDFVDTSEPGEELPHGSYLLVTNMPRKVQGMTRRHHAMPPHFT